MTPITPKIPSILIIGQSGSGKSSSLRNLPPATTLIINTEQKMSPFPSGTLIPTVWPKTVLEFDQEVRKGLENPVVEVIVIESLTRYFQLLETFAQSVKKGYEVWAFYAQKIDELLAKADNSGKVFVFLAIDDCVKLMQEDMKEISQRRAWVQGKVWSGKIEQRFTTVLYTSVAGVGEARTYHFITNADGLNSAKSPHKMLPYRMDNDVAAVIAATRTHFASMPVATSSSETKKP